MATNPGSSETEGDWLTLGNFYDNYHEGASCIAKRSDMWAVDDEHANKIAARQDNSKSELDYLYVVYANKRITTLHQGSNCAKGKKHHGGSVSPCGALMALYS